MPRVKARSLRVYWIVDEAAQQLVAVDLLADLDSRTHAVDVLLRGAEAVDAGDGRDHDHVAAGEQRMVAECRSRSTSSLIEESFSM